MRRDVRRRCSAATRLETIALRGARARARDIGSFVHHRVLAYALNEMTLKRYVLGGTTVAISRSLMLDRGAIKLTARAAQRSGNRSLARDFP